MRSRRRIALLLAAWVAVLAAPSRAQRLAEPLPTLAVEIAGERFALEVARDPETQYRGLGGRTHIARDGGMLFVFPRPRLTGFVMRDCPIPIDVAYLDAEGRVIAIHAMKPEPPRRPDETPIEYEARLPNYPSGLPTRHVIETAGGRMAELGLRPGDRIELPPEVR